MGALLAFVKHQALMRAYQARYVLLPEARRPGGGAGALCAAITTSAGYRP